MAINLRKLKLYKTNKVIKELANFFEFMAKSAIPISRLFFACFLSVPELFLLKLTNNIVILIAVFVLIVIHKNELVSFLCITIINFATTRKKYDLLNFITIGFILLALLLAIYLSAINIYFNITDINKIIQNIEDRPMYIIYFGLLLGEIPIWIKYFTICKFIFQKLMKKRNVSILRVKMLRICMAALVVWVGLLATTLQPTIVNNIINLAVCIITFSYPILDTYIYVRSVWENYKCEDLKIEYVYESISLKEEIEEIKDNISSCTIWLCCIIVGVIILLYIIIILLLW